MPWETITPLGVEVEPEVYWRKAIASPGSSGSRHSAASDAGISSVASQESAFTPSFASQPATRADAAEVDIATAGEESSRIDCRRGSMRGERGG